MNEKLFIPFWLCLFWMFGSIDVGNGSACPLEHVQQKYCRADFVLKLTPKNCTSTGTWQQCKVVIKSQIKISKEFMNLEDEILRNLYLQQGAPLEEDVKYIVSGSVERISGAKSLTSGSCDWIQKWADVSHRHKAALRKAKFERGCGCFRVHPDQVENVTNDCRIIDGSLESRCYLKHAHCIKRALSSTAFRCQWTKSGEVKRCISGDTGN